MRLNGGDDRESTEHWKKEWMYERNVAVVRRAEAEKASNEKAAAAAKAPSSPPPSPPGC